MLPLAVAEARVGLAVEDPVFRAALTPLLALLRRASHIPAAPVLQLRGCTERWRLAWAGATTELASGHEADAALTAVLRALIDLACLAKDRLLVIHGAGLALPDGTGLLLIAPGGSGKTTLATALNAEGLALLSDDVVPVDETGRLVALHTPICVKAGSWPVLARQRPDLAAAPTLQRYGQPVRYLPPLGPSPAKPLTPRLLLFPRYQPGCAPHTEALTPEQALQELIEAEAVIRDLTQAKLTALARWVSALPAQSLTYPDLASGLALARAALSKHPPRPGRSSEWG